MSQKVSPGIKRKEQKMIKCLFNTLVYEGLLQLLVGEANVMKMISSFED